MRREDELREWRKNRRKSLAALPGQVTVAVVAWTLLGAAYLWLRIPLLAALGFGALASFGLIGDLINVFYLSRRIAEAETERDEEPR